MKAETGDKATLERRESALDLWMYFGMLAVLLGVIVENVPDFFSSAPALLGNAHRVGGSAIVLGLLAEFIVDIKLRKNRAGLKEISDREFGAVLERASIAEQAAAEANLARATLEAHFTPRRLTESARQELVEKLKRDAGRSIDIVAFDEMLGDVSRLFLDFEQIFKDAGWNVNATRLTHGKRISGEGLAFGLAREIKEPDNSKLQGIISNVRTILAGEGISCSKSLGLFSVSQPLLDGNPPLMELSLFRLEIAERPMPVFGEPKSLLGGKQVF